MAMFAGSGARLVTRLGRRAVSLACMFVVAASSIGTADHAYAQADAFSVEVAVADRSASEREAAYAAALRSVLLANSRDKTLMNRDDVRLGLDRAESFVETYRYREPEPGSLIPSGTPVTETVRQSGEATGLLLVRFDRVRVLGLIDGSEPADNASVARTSGGVDAESPGAFGQPMLDENGNPVDPFVGISSALVWLVIDDGTRTIRGSDPEAQKVRERMREIAGGAGITLVFPDAQSDASLDAQSSTESGALPGALPSALADRGDAGEVEAVLAADAIRLGDEAAIRNASLRYRADVVLSGHLSRIDAVEQDAQTDRATLSSRVRRDRGIGRTARVDRDGEGSGWQGNWMRLATGAVNTGSNVGASERTRSAAPRLDEALRDGVAWLAGDATIGQPAEYVYGGSGSDTEALVRFDGIGSLGSYADVLALLEGVPGVASAWPKEVMGDTMVFAVLPRSALGEVSAVARTVTWLRRSATPVERYTSDVTRNVELAFDVLR